MLDIKKLSLFSILISFSVILSLIDKYISSFVFIYIPNAKIGLANIVILYSLYMFSFKESIIIALMKSVLSSLIFGSLSTFIIGGTATIASFLIMSFLKYFLSQKINILSISIIGGFIHTITQLIIISLMYSIGKEIIIYGIPLFLFSFISSICVALFSNKVIYIYKNKSI